MDYLYHTFFWAVRKEAFVTLKDHKDNFANKPTCRLINPSKQEIGKISKQILENINQNLVKATSVNQWKNTSSVLQWYKNLLNKCESAFVCFDVVEFYPSITDDLLQRALDFASNYVNISSDDCRIIIRAKQSLLFNNEIPWQKRNSNTLFDVTMGSYDGAETCELVGCYLLSQLTQIPEISIGLYRDDGLAVINQTLLRRLVTTSNAKILLDQYYQTLKEIFKSPSSFRFFFCFFFF